MNSTTKHTSRPSSGRSKRRMSTGRRLAVAGLIGATTMAGVVLGADIASAGPTASTADGSQTYTIEKFRETIKPWDSITIPTMICNSGWLVDQDYSPGRLVPRGVEITGDSGLIGTTISHTKFGSDGGIRANYGTDALKGNSTATNWDPFSSHELVVNLHCTTDPSQASLRPEIPGFPES
jgi:hypothetical protein